MKCREQVACLIREAGKGPQGWTSPAAAAAAAAAEARAAAAAAAEGVLSSPSSACATPMGAAAANRLDIEVHDTVAAAAALLELSSGRKRRLTFDHTHDYSQTDSEDAGSPPVHSFKPTFKPVFRDADADGMSDGSQHSSDHTCMGGAASPGSTAISKQQRMHSPPAACNTSLAGPFSPATPASASSPATAAAAAAAAAALAVSNAGSSPPPVELLAHQRRVQLHMIEQVRVALVHILNTSTQPLASQCRLCSRSTRPPPPPPPSMHACFPVLNTYPTLPTRSLVPLTACRCWTPPTPSSAPTTAS